MLLREQNQPPIIITPRKGSGQQDFTQERMTTLQFTGNAKI